MSQLIVEYTSKISSPEDEDPLVAIRKQELALKRSRVIYGTTTIYNARKT